MTSKIFFLLFLTIFIACSQKSKNRDNIYIVPKPYNPETAKKTDVIPPPITTYYFAFNFIIDTAEQVYFYQRQQETGWSCETDLDYNTPPPFIDLKPKDLLRIPIKGLPDFIKFNLLNTDNKYTLVSVASTKDTIKSAALTDIFKIFADRSNKIKWAFRKVTQEESLVLKHKELNLKYYAGDMEWDSTKIRFISPLYDR